MEEVRAVESAEWVEDNAPKYLHSFQNMESRGDPG